ncbi:hypothetical protein LIER_00157 [Lithospermum erythrorhizon]|uniref:Uncharacterized protein n=1 Tax=Lithospermum erythrorhizon TaxID=34254 RepID=A0AAV3NHJ6_LITER
MTRKAPLRHGVITRAQSALGGTHNPRFDIPPNTKGQGRKPHRGGDTEHARATSEEPRAPPKARSYSSDSHSRQPSHTYGYDLTPLDSSPERSPGRENRPAHEGVVTIQSLKQHPYKDRSKKGSRRSPKQAVGRLPSTKRDTRGSSNTELQKQVDELKALLKDITPGRGPVKHSTLLPFSERIRHAKMP